jgi:hypothetical protein
MLIMLPCLFINSPSFADALWSSYSPGARRAALADADTAIPANEDGLFHNPAGLADLKSKSVRVQTIKGLEDIRGAGMGVLLPTSRAGTWGLHLNNATSGSMEVNDGAGNLLGELDAQTELAASAGWAGNLQHLYPGLPPVSLGAVARYFQEEIAESGADTGQSIDMGAQFRFLKNRAILGVAFQNLAGQIGSDDLPRLWSAGASYLFVGNKVHRGLIDLDMARLENGETSPRLGGEYVYHNLLTLRGGAALRGKGNEDRWGAGIGMRLPVGSNRVELDYAYRTAGDLGGVHAIDLSWRWDSPQKSAPAKKKKNASKPIKLKL